MPNGITTMNHIPATNRPTLQPVPTSELAAVGEGIVSRLSAVLEHKIGITNLSGNIVADSDLTNFDKFVPSAIAAIQKGDTVRLPAGEVDSSSGWIIPLRHQDRLFGTLIIRNEPEPSDDVIPLAKSLSELLLYQMLVMERLAQENRVLDKFFYDLFENEQPNEKLLRDSIFFSSQFFHIDFSQPRVAAVLIIKDFWSDVFNNQPILPADEHRLTSIKDQIKEVAQEKLGTTDLTVAYLGLDEFALLLPHKIAVEKEGKKKDAKKADTGYAFTNEVLAEMVAGIREKFDHPAYLGLGQYHPEISGLVASYKGAKKAARLGMKLMPKQEVFLYSELLLPIILEQADRGLQKQFVENELGGLIQHPDLVETLSTHFDSNLNLKKTAYELGIHKNTLYYRLAKIKKVLGVDPQEFGQAIRLKAALYLWQMLKEDSPAEAIA